ncbi:MAG: hypothetical protein A3I75_00090 [Deltaproteobacteria bacterium RIFCSPLOWO2_02_FULL_50_16]|nr:MAG: hypothetical protein A3B79_03760 [Deltaproteobacteria bacterium RIFCSPHIGHO2_02_FULL_50_15]OGQ58193.1 MAG: hypothetical protein A3I75_00090 [Deltaproteobacteria bacterium RIFCSPLOWO2_02_FULL_50_16]OGQ68954.1 MAG: hypothetical protein A3F89_01160 [Deltaproteobacteria bacterium RIFCSPLOWO2_12_FULL_50_11]
MAFLNEFITYLPETVLAGTSVLLIVLITLLPPREKSKREPFSYIALLGLMGSAFPLLAGLVPQQDNMSIFFKIFFLAATFFVVLFSQHSRELFKTDTGTYYLLLIGSSLALLIIASATHFLILYLALEMLSLMTYLLVGSLKGTPRSSEAAIKYLIYGGTTTGIMLYGMTLFYGISGSLALNQIAEIMNRQTSLPILFYVALLMTLVGIGFKLTMVPFHMWAPDTYEGAPTPIAAFLALISKAAGLVFLLRLSLALGMIPEVGAPFLSPLIAVLAIATMTVGNLGLLRQNSIKRLLAYSSMTHLGYILMGGVSLEPSNLKGIFFYLIIEAVLHLGLFLIIILLNHQETHETLSDFQGLAFRGRVGALMAGVLTLFVIGLAGLPPTSGFVSRFHLFETAIRSQWFGLALIGGANSLLSLWGYTKMIKIIYFKTSQKMAPLRPPGLRDASILLTFCIVTVYLGLQWAPLIQWLDRVD